MTKQVAYGYSEVLPDLDFETYSEAGYIWVEGKLQSTLGKGKKGGLPAVGSLLYSLHPSTEVLCMAYDLKDGLGKRLWHPALPAPQELFDHVRSMGLIESWNTTFEHHVWNNVCTPKYGFPPLHYTQQRDAMAKARAFSLPAKLGKAALVLGTLQQKDKEGTRLLNKFSKPRNPTAKDKRNRILPDPSDPDSQLLYDYCLQDIATEEDISSCIPDLNPDELEFWLNTCKSNYAGVGIRPEEVDSCINILEQAYTKYNLELANITDGEVMESTKVEQLRQWCATQGVNTPTLDDDSTKALLKQEIPLNVRRALEIRQMIGSAGVKKVYAMKKIASPEGRLCDLFIYHGARTGRDTGAEVQPQNLTKAGPRVTWCGGCDKPFGPHWKDVCPHCGASLALLSYVKDDGKWTWEAVDHAMEAITTRSLEYVEWVFGNAVLTISGCIRGLFVAAEGKEFICSDYSAIEAVVLAALAGEQWRLDTFHAKEDIYLKSASTITGTTMQEYKDYAKQTGSKHPDRQKLGKVAELASGYAGWIGAWKNFGADKFYSDDEIKGLIVAWRDASPTIPEFWGGQVRGKPWKPSHFEYFGLEGAFVQAIRSPNQCFMTHGISFGMRDDALFVRLPSGRILTYHRPRLTPHPKYEGQLSISYEGWNSNALMGPIGWFRMETYGGKLCENIVQAVSRDIMAFAVNNLERAGYNVVIRVHDEIVAEIPEGSGDIEEFERIMATLPPWAQGWPIRASGGWVGKRYRKD